MKKEEFEAWFQRNQFSEQTKTLIQYILKSSPSRRVGGGYANYTVLYPSELTQETRQAESYRCEFPAIYKMEWEREGENPVEYYVDQPPPFRVRFQNAEGLNISTEQTSDFFVFRAHEAGWEEWAREEELLELQKKYPVRYYKDGIGLWRDSAGEEYAKPYGLYYRLRSTAEINWVFQRNIRWLEDFLVKACPPVPPERRELIRAYVADRPGIPLNELYELASQQLEVDTVDVINTLIAKNEVYVDLYEAPIAEPSQVHVFISKELAPTIDYRAKKIMPTFALASVRTGCALNWDSRIWKVINVGESKVSLLADDGQVMQFFVEQIESLICKGQILVESPSEDADAIGRDLSDVHPRDLANANRDCFLINNYLQNGTLPPHAEMPERTFFRKLAKYRDAEMFYGDGFLGLVPKYRVTKLTPGLSEESRQLMLDFINNDYENLKQKTKLASWRQLKLAAEDKGVGVPSYKLYCVAIDNRPIADQVMKRLGNRASYQVKEFYWDLELKTPRHGDRPFEILHIDHTQLDVQLRASNDQEFSEKPWLTLLIDAYSRRVLAFYLSFDKPSHRSCMMVTRECVRRFNRFGQILVVDGGKEFQSKYMDFVVVRMLKASKMTRPPASPRSAPLIERMFGITNTQFIHNLLGHTKIMRNVRQVTKSVNPKEFKTWTLPELYDRLKEYFFEVRDNLVHPALGYNETPRQAFDRGMLKGGRRLSRIVIPDRRFIMMTMPTTDKGTAKVVPSRGIKINYLFYNCDALRAPHLRGKRVHVRYDPSNMGIAFAFVDGQWRECISQFYAVFKGRSYLEVMLASEELRQRNEYAAKAGFTVNAQTLAEFIMSVEGQEKLLLQRIKDMECQDIRSKSTAEMSTPASTDGSTGPACEDIQGVATASAQVEDDFAGYESF